MSSVPNRATRDLMGLLESKGKSRTYNRHPKGLERGIEREQGYARDAGDAAMRFHRNMGLFESDRSNAVSENTAAIALIELLEAKGGRTYNRHPKGSPRGGQFARKAGSIAKGSLATAGEGVAVATGGAIGGAMGGAFLAPLMGGEALKLGAAIGAASGLSTAAGRHMEAGAANRKTAEKRSTKQGKSTQISRARAHEAKGTALGLAAAGTAYATYRYATGKPVSAREVRTAGSKLFGAGKNSLKSAKRSVARHRNQRNLKKLWNNAKVIESAMSNNENTAAIALMELLEAKGGRGGNQKRHPKGSSKGGQFAPGGGSGGGYLKTEKGRKAHLNREGERYNAAFAKYGADRKAARGLATRAERKAEKKVAGEEFAKASAKWEKSMGKADVGGRQRRQDKRAAKKASKGKSRMQRNREELQMRQEWDKSNPMGYSRAKGAARGALQSGAYGGAVGGLIGGSVAGPAGAAALGVPMAIGGAVGGGIRGAIRPGGTTTMRGMRKAGKLKESYWITEAQSFNDALAKKKMERAAALAQSAQQLGNGYPAGVASMGQPGQMTPQAGPPAPGAPPTPPGEQPPGAPPVPGQPSDPLQQIAQQQQAAQAQIAQGQQQQIMNQAQVQQLMDLIANKDQIIQQLIGQKGGGGNGGKKPASKKGAPDAPKLMQEASRFSEILEAMNAAARTGSVAASADGQGRTRTKKTDRNKKKKSPLSNSDSRVGGDPSEPEAVVTQ